MTTTKTKILLPVLFSFFIVSFVDLVGTGVDELKQSAETPAYLLQLIPFVAFIWFFLLSVPAGIWQAKVGKKKVLNTSILITAAGLFIPVLGNSLAVILISFSFLGIGNTIMQVAANPLLMDVVPADKGSGFLSFSQFMKSLGSMVGPYVAAVVGPSLAGRLGFEGEGAWRFGLYLFGIIAFASYVWLQITDIEETKSKGAQVSFKSCIQLLSNRYIALMVLGIFAIVGVDVAINSNIGTFLHLKIGMGEETAKYGKSVYFFAKMVGTFMGGVLLMKGNAKVFLRISTLVALVFVGALTLVQNDIAAWILVGIVSLGVSNVFPLIFSITVGNFPDRSNEISGLMMMAISGGAIFPFLVGLAMNYNVNGGLWIIGGLMAFILILSVVKVNPRVQ
ncbi:glucose/galactose transporter [Saccharicrinis fermentans DSM 9555 = JCM 21142]|uniref:Glucose/galactose transporter n=2 Tax=Saccharicrinis fermentans TaxID=982 RepID=W7Y227_9BACT|nr:glucose/galactose transporter [Saccharicrinis fermentans DSM 9555 = JCM 21142]